ncbi:hypothetical protein PMAYCL1PPCAC_03533, partial [Pristionchus mayeri]
MSPNKEFFSIMFKQMIKTPSVGTTSIVRKLLQYDLTFKETISENDIEYLLNGRQNQPGCITQLIGTNQTGAIKIMLSII